MSRRRLLISYAHPDDESFGNGGLIAKYVAQGTDVYLICATDGDRGTIPDEMKDQYDSIRALRLAELDCAARQLGLKRVFTFGYRDSGMMGSETTQDPECLWHRWQTEPDVVTQRVVDVMREIRPQVVVTFNRYGGYGHPDHIAIQQATERAFYHAGDPDYTKSTLPPYQPQKLYYSGLPTTALRFLLWTLRLRGQDPRKMGVNKDIDFMAVVENIEPVHARVNIRRYLRDWDAASACHRSQGGGTAGRFPMWLRQILLAHQGFTRVYPMPQRDGVDEYDLFAGVHEDQPEVEIARSR